MPNTTAWVYASGSVSAPYTYNSVTDPYRHSQPMKTQMFRSMKMFGAAAATMIVMSCGGGNGYEEAPLKALDADIQGYWPTKSYVARNVQEWTSIWAEHNISPDSKPLPVVNFQESMLVGIAFPRENNCDQVVFARALNEGGITVVEYKRLSPTSKEIICLELNGSVVNFALLPASTGQVSFESVPAQ